MVRNDLCVLLRSHLRCIPSRCFFTLPRVITPKKQEYSKRKVLGYDIEQVYDVVSDVDSYCQFLPWCRESRVFGRRGNHCKGLLVVGFPPLVERYVSNMTMVRPHFVEVSCAKPLCQVYVSWKVDFLDRRFW